MRIAIAPPAASALTFDSVGIEANIRPAMAVTAMNAAVQVACPETALSPIERLRIAEPETKTQSEDMRISAVQREHGSPVEVSQRKNIVLITIFPIGPNMIPAASSIPYTSGWRRLN